MSVRPLLLHYRWQRFYIGFIFCYLQRYTWTTSFIGQAAPITRFNKVHNREQRFTSICRWKHGKYCCCKDFKHEERSGMTFQPRNSSFSALLSSITFSNRFFSMFSKSTLKSVNLCFQIELLWNSINCISNSSISIHENFCRFSSSIFILSGSGNLINFAVSSSSLNLENLVKNCWPTDSIMFKKSFWRLWRSVRSSFWISWICLLRFQKYLNLSSPISFLKTSSFFSKAFMYPNVTSSALPLHCNLIFCSFRC